VRPVPYPGRSASWTGHQTHATDPLGCVRSRTQRGLQITLTPNAGTGPTVSASDVLSEVVQLAVNGAPDALCSASGAASSASGAPVLCGKQVAGPWTWWGVFILLHLVDGRSLAHLIRWEIPCGAREKQEPREDWELSDFLSESFSSWVLRVHVCIHHSLETCLGSSESSLLVTLGGRHHLDGLMVIGGTKTALSSYGWLVSSLWAVLGDSPQQSVEESTRREHLVLARTKGSKTLARVLQRGLVASGDSSIHRQNIATFFLLSSFTF